MSVRDEDMICSIQRCVGVHLGVNELFKELSYQIVKSNFYREPGSEI